MKLLVLSFVAMTLVVFAQREIDTKLTVRGGNPPKFYLSGNGDLSFIRVGGPKRQREKMGEDASIYWMIKVVNPDLAVDVRDLSPITYGVLPKGYKQIYPEAGDPPELVEGEKYYVRVETYNANGDSGWFKIKSRQVIFSRYEHELNKE